MANIQPMGAVRGEGNNAIPVEHGIEAASQSYKKGMPLIASSGSVAIMGANPTTVLGVSLAPATGVTGADAPFVPCDPDTTIFEVSVDGALSASNAPGTGTPANFTKWATYGISIDAASGLAYLDSSKSGANQVMRLLDYDTDQTNVINGRVRCRWLRTSATLYV